MPRRFQQYHHEHSDHPKILEDLRRQWRRRQDRERELARQGQIHPRPAPHQPPRGDHAMTDRNHTIRALLDGCATGQIPTAEDWATLPDNLTPSQRRAVETAARAALDARAEGNHAQARQIARDASEGIVATIDPLTQPASGQRPDPKALADAVHGDRIA